MGLTSSDSRSSQCRKAHIAPIQSTEADGWRDNNCDEMKKLLYLLLTLMMVISCDDEFATGSDAQPVASADTLHLGTLLAGNSSQTYLLKLYNPNSKELKLTSIALRNASSSGFRMNVDGMNGTSFDNSDLLRISSGDSLYVFVEATFPQTGLGIQYHTDYIDVVCNGRTSTIVLDATSKDVKKLQAYTVTQNETWDNATEVQIYDSLVVARGVTLRLTDSTTLYLHDKANIVVYGTMTAQGTIDRPVTIRGDRTDNMFDNLPYDNLPSQWGSLYLKEESVGNSFQYANIRGMSDGLWVESQAEFANCRIKNSDGNLITAVGASICLENCELKNAAGSLLDIVGGEVEVVHCTLANYNFAASIRQEALRLTNQDTLRHMTAPLYKCDFVNTILWGRKYCPDIRFDYQEPESGDSIFCYRFDHCLIHADGTDDSQFVSTIWNTDPEFLLIDEKNYTYDLHLNDNSVARGAGAEETTTRIKSDIDGKLRQSPPTIGCYE